jgi:hypothetical protein
MQLWVPLLFHFQVITSKQKISQKTNLMVNSKFKFYIPDRAFRIYHNKMVQDSDKFAVVSSVLLAPFLYQRRKSFKGIFELGLGVGTMIYFAKRKIFGE